MANFGDIGFKDSTHFDAFGRMKTSEPYPLFDSMFEYGLNPFLWETSTSGGSVVHRPNECSMRLSTGGTTDANSAILQTKKYMRYQPGRSLNIETTFVMSTAVTNGRARIGYFDARNGMFLERTGTTVNIVRRTYVTGSAVDTAVAKASWNVDIFDGSGPSGKTLDLTKTQILFIQLQFLGVGRVQVGFIIDGIPYVAHQFLNANSLSTVYMSTGCLPVRGEVVNAGTASGTLTMDMICTSVSSGGVGQEKIRFSRSNGITGISTAATIIPILSIRAATLLGGTAGGGSITNRGHIEIVDAIFNCASNEHEFQVILNGTLTGPSWAANGAASIADYDVTASAISGGTIVEATYVPSTNTVHGTSEVSIYNVIPLVYSNLNSVQDIITIAARATTSTGTAKAVITWDEQY